MSLVIQGLGGKANQEKKPIQKHTNTNTKTKLQKIMHEYEFKHLEATRPVVSIRKATQTYVHCEKRGICVRGIHTNLMSTGRVRFTFGKLVQRVLQLVKHARTAPRCQVLGTSRKDI